MAKKCLILRQQRRLFLVEKHYKKRLKLKKVLNNLNNYIVLNKKFIYFHKKLCKLPKDSSVIRLKNRCRVTGRARGFIKEWGISRIMFRKYAEKGLLPGIIKSSW